MGYIFYSPASFPKVIQTASFSVTQGRLDLLSCVEKAGWITAADDLVQCVVFLKKIESEMQKRVRCDLYFPYRSQEKWNGEIIKISPRLFSILILFQSKVLFSFSNTARRPCLRVIHPAFPNQADFVPAAPRSPYWTSHRFIMAQAASKAPLNTNRA